MSFLTTLAIWPLNIELSSLTKQTKQMQSRAIETTRSKVPMIHSGHLTDSNKNLHRFLRLFSVLHHCLRSDWVWLLDSSCRMSMSSSWMTISTKGRVITPKISTLLVELLYLDNGWTRAPVMVSRKLDAISTGKRTETVKKLKMSWTVAAANALLKFSLFVWINKVSLAKNSEKHQEWTENYHKRKRDKCACDARSDIWTHNDRNGLFYFYNLK